MEKCLQETFAPELTCFGCGPKNELGLRIKSFVDGDCVVADFKPETHHVAYQGMLNGGVIGALLDCHMNWAAAWYLMQRLDLEKPPCTVTAEYTVKFLVPTPLNETIRLVAQKVSSSDRKVEIEATLGTANEVTAKGKGIFVSVKPGHPAYHRW